MVTRQIPYDLTDFKMIRAADQLRRYAAAPKVHVTRGDTELRLVTLA